MSGDKNSKTLNGAGLGTVWGRVAQFIALLVGDVRTDTDGTLQEQIDAVNQEIDELKYGLFIGKINFNTATESGDIITTESGERIISEIKL